MRLTIDPLDADPPYEQLRAQVTAQVDSGELAPGERMPTVRALAAELGLAANTVARAYRELEQRGVISTRGRAGTFVSGDDVEREAKQAASAYVEKVRALGVGDDDALALVRRQLGRP